MDDRKYDTKEQTFFKELVNDIRKDIYDVNEGKTCLTLLEHLNNVNKRVSDTFSTTELLEMEQSVKDAVQDITDLDINVYLCTGVVVLSEYLYSPEEILDYMRIPRRRQSVTIMFEPIVDYSTK